MADFPAYFAINRYRPNIDNQYPTLEPYKNLAVLIHSTKNANGTWVLELIENPLLLLEGYRVTNTTYDRWFNNRIVELPVCKHESTTTILMRSRFNDSVLETPEYIIPLLKISDPCEVLSRKFYNLPENLSCGFELLSSARVVSTPEISPKNNPIQTSKIPDHIIEIYIQNLLDKKEVCPITMEPLQRDSLHITSCGHAMSKGAAERWLNQKNSCPVCRTALK